MQSMGLRQLIISAHFFWGAHDPPQSTPVSSPFLTLSLQAAIESIKYLTYGMYELEIFVLVSVKKLYADAEEPQKLNLDGDN